MSEFTEFIEVALREVPLPPSAAARADAVARAKTELRLGVEQERPRSGLNRARVGIAIAVAAACVAVIALTPPGRAVAEWIGDLVSGDDSEPQSTAERLFDAVAIGTGEAPGDASYQVVADLDVDEGLCIYIRQLSDSERLEGGELGGCGIEAPTEGEVRAPFVELAGEGRVIVGGLAPIETERVELSYRERGRGGAGFPVSTELFKVVPSIFDSNPNAARAPSLAFFVGFLPSDLDQESSGPAPLATAIGAGGRRMAAGRVSWLVKEVVGTRVAIPCDPAPRDEDGRCVSPSPSP